ncbi:MAG: hypothetical protein QXY49_00705 [Thermofilaceae archaeon]
MAEPVISLECDEPDAITAEFARGLMLIALVKGKPVTLDSLVRLAMNGFSEGGWSAGGELAKLEGRVGLSRAVEYYIASGAKYLFVAGGSRLVLAPRSLARIASKSISPFEVTGKAMAPAVVAPNATLRGALKRMMERGSICVFVVRAGKLKGVVDAWTAVRMVAESSSEVLDIPCSEIARSEALCSSYTGLFEALSRYGFAALIRESVYLIDDISLLKVMRESSKKWVNSLRGVKRG